MKNVSKMVLFFGCMWTIFSGREGTAIAATDPFSVCENAACCEANLAECQSHCGLLQPFCYELCDSGFQECLGALPSGVPNQTPEPTTWPFPSEIPSSGTPSSTPIPPEPVGNGESQTVLVCCDPETINVFGMEIQPVIFPSESCLKGGAGRACLGNIGRACFYFDLGGGVSITSDGEILGGSCYVGIAVTW